MAINILESEIDQDAERNAEKRPERGRALAGRIGAARV